VEVNSLARRLGRKATLDDLPDAELDRLAGLGFDWVYLLGVWQTGAVAPAISRANPEWRQEYRALLPDLSEADICGSCFAVTGFTVHADLGGNAALERLRERLRRRGLRLMLDFVPNHTAPDHPWVAEHPEYFVPGTAEQLALEPQNFTRVSTPQGERIFAYGRDPYFPGWPDTLQLNYGELALQEAMIGELLKVAALCDGARCDMAMLVLPEVFQRTWGIAAEPFWSRAAERIRDRHPGFVLMAEVYWDLEWTLQQQGFDYTYDKRLYDRLRDRQTRAVREHFWAAPDYQERSARFLENHDEPRAAAVFPVDAHLPAAVLTFFCPGLRFLHQGQLQGWQQKISVHLCRGPEQPTDRVIEEFYGRLLPLLSQDILKNGEWQLLECTPAWDGNGTWDGFVAFAWRGGAGEQWLVTVNYAPNQGQCYLRLPFPELQGASVRLNGLLSETSYDRDGNDLIARGLYLDLPPWGYHVFELRR
jgi:hypothetical protein